CCACRISNFPQLHACACSNLGPVDLDFVKIAAVRVNHHAPNPTIADEKIRPATHHEKWEGFISAKSNQCGKRVLALWLDPKLRRAAYAQRGVFGERLIKAHVAAFAHDRP